MTKSAADFVMTKVICEGCQKSFQLWQDIVNRSKPPYFCGWCRWFDIKSREEGSKFYGPRPGGSEG